MTQFLPPNLLALFAPRDPIPFLPPPDKLPHEKKNRGYLGVGSFIKFFEDPKDTPPPTRVETREERLERRRRERAEQVAYKLEQEIAVWDPHNISNATGDPFKTLFVARINYDTSESKLRREFEVYGPIKKIVVTHNTINGKPRGYAFIEYEHERDMHSAYKHADGKKIDGRRVLVDVERARTVKGWLPRRLGGGLGGTRRGGPDVNIKHSGREDNERERERYRLETEREAARASRGNRDRDRYRSRSRDRDRDRERKRRSRSRSNGRERKRRRSRDRMRDPDIEEIEERSRDRDRDRDRKRRRSRSREKDKERERRRRERRERREREERERGREEEVEEVRIKEEPIDGEEKDPKRKRIRSNYQHKPHVCMFCLQKVDRINEHLKRKHANEEAVMNILNMKKGPEKLWEWTKLVREGDDFYNCLISIEGGRVEEFMSVRRPAVPRRQRKYVICSACSARIISRNFKKHMTLCRG